MSWLYEKSSTWRGIVQRTRSSNGAMYAFTAACLGVSAIAGVYTMRFSAPNERQQQPIKQHASGDAGKVADANKERLQQLLDEVKTGGSVSDERYKMALQGRTKGTRVGTSMRSVSDCDGPSDSASSAQSKNRQHG